MFQVIFETVLGELALDAVSWAAHTGSIRASALNHETVDNTVEDQAVIKAFFYKADEVIYCVRGNFRI